MRFVVYPSTVGSGGGGLSSALKNFDFYIHDELQRFGFESSFDEFRVELRYPPIYVYSGNAPYVPYFWSDYETLPSSRIFRKTKYIEVRCKAPGQHGPDIERQRKIHCYRRGRGFE